MNDSLPKRRQRGRCDKTSLRLRALGRSCISTHGDRAISNLSRKGRGILYLLALRGGDGLHKEVLMDTFWRGYASESARNCLNVTLHGLRKSLNGDRGGTCRQWVIFLDDCYAIDPQLALDFDVLDFERCVHRARIEEHRQQYQQAIAGYCEALALYSGEFLTGEPFAEWADNERRRLAELRLTALEHLARLHEQLDAAEMAERQWREILQHDRCREDAHRGLMRCFARSGQRARALRQFADCRDALQREFELQPEPETVELLEKIRLGEQLDESLSAA